MRDVLEGQPVGERTWKVVYTIVERSPTKKKWVRIGAAFPNKDGSWNVKLDANPTNGQLHIREPDPLPERLEPTRAASFEMPKESSGVSDWLMEGGAR